MLIFLYLYIYSRFTISSPDCISTYSHDVHHWNSHAAPPLQYCNHVIRSAYNEFELIICARDVGDCTMQLGLKTLKQVYTQCVLIQIVKIIPARECSLHYIKHIKSATCTKNTHLLYVCTHNSHISNRTVIYRS